MALLKVTGLRFSSPTTPIIGGELLSKFATARAGDVLVDEDGNPLLIGTVGVPFNSEPDDGDLALGETNLWFEITSGTVFSKTKNLVGTIFRTDLGAGGTEGSDFMLKPDYDSNDDNVVNAADMLVGTLGTTTADELRAHIDDGTIHTQIADGLTSSAFAWSSAKIASELAIRDTAISGKSEIGHTHPDFTLTVPGFVPAPGADDSDLVLHTDGTWGAITGFDTFFAAKSVNDLADVDTVGVAVGEILVFNGSEWERTEITTSPNLTVVYSPGANTLDIIFSVPGSGS